MPPMEIMQDHKKKKAILSLFIRKGHDEMDMLCFECGLTCRLLPSLF